MPRRKWDAKTKAMMVLEGLKGKPVALGIHQAFSETDPEKIIRKQAEAQVQREGIPEDATERLLLDMSENPVYRRRVEEIEAELYREYRDE